MKIFHHLCGAVSRKTILNWCKMIDETGSSNITVSPGPSQPKTSLKDQYSFKMSVISKGGSATPYFKKQAFVGYGEMIWHFARISKQFFHWWARLKNSKEKNLQIRWEQISKKKALWKSCFLTKKSLILMEYAIITIIGCALWIGTRKPTANKNEHFIKKWWHGSESVEKKFDHWLFWTKGPSISTDKCCHFLSTMETRFWPMIGHTNKTHAQQWSEQIFPSFTDKDHWHRIWIHLITQYGNHLFNRWTGTKCNEKTWKLNNWTKKWFLTVVTHRRSFNKRELAMFRLNKIHLQMTNLLKKNDDDTIKINSVIDKTNLCHFWWLTR